MSPRVRHPPPDPVTHPETSIHRTQTLSSIPRSHPSTRDPVSQPKSPINCLETPSGTLRVCQPSPDPIHHSQTLSAVPSHHQPSLRVCHLSLGPVHHSQTLSPVLKPRHLSPDPVSRPESLSPVPRPHPSYPDPISRPKTLVTRPQTPSPISDPISRARRTQAFRQGVPGELTSFFRFRGFPGLFSFCFRGPRFFFFTPRAPSRPRSSSSSPSAGTRQPEPRGHTLAADRDGWLCEVPSAAARTVTCRKIGDGDSQLRQGPLCGHQDSDTQ